MCVNPIGPELTREQLEELLENERQWHKSTKHELNCAQEVLLARGQKLIEIKTERNVAWKEAKQYHNALKDVRQERDANASEILRMQKRLDKVNNALGAKLDEDARRAPTWAKTLREYHDMKEEIVRLREGCNGCILLDGTDYVCPVTGEREESKDTCKECGSVDNKSLLNNLEHKIGFSAASWSKSDEKDK